MYINCVLAGPKFGGAVPLLASFLDCEQSRAMAVPLEFGSFY